MVAASPAGGAGGGGTPAAKSTALGYLRRKSASRRSQYFARIKSVCMSVCAVFVEASAREGPRPDAEPAPRGPATHHAESEVIS